MTSYIYPRRSFTINIDYSRDSLMSVPAKEVMKDRYFQKEYNFESHTWKVLETSPQECFARAACEFATDQAHAQRMYDYVSKCWMMFATPILTNAGSKRDLPISCYLSDIHDSRDGIINHIHENAYLASLGGGIGSNWGSLRADGTATSSGNISTGVIPFMKMVDSEMLAFQQGATRRASYAAYIDVSHPEIEEFISIRRENKGDIHRRCLGSGFHNAVNIPDTFMQAVEKGEPWNLVDPHTKQVRKTVDARTLWMEILITRIEKGEPYLHFIDRSNEALPQALKDKGLRIKGSNLCSEITLPTATNRTAVCCLSSPNLEYFDDWSKTNMIADLVEYLDNVLSYFIDNAPKELWRAVASAKAERSIGIGAMGFHLYLQKNNIPFESAMAIGQNMRMFAFIKESALEASKALAKTRGDAPDMQGTGLRFAHLMAIAPNANIGSICGDTSPSIEPFNANGYKWNTQSGTFLMKNKQLDKVLKEKYNLAGEALDEVWSSIIITEGSVQHLSFMEQWDKDVFKTAFELDQAWIIEHAAKRQPFVCQSQSVNLFLRPDVHKSQLHQLHFAAWKKGLKSLYYMRSKPIRQTGAVSNTNVNETIEAKQKAVSDCLACEG